MITFYYEWLSLIKADFKAITLFTEKGGFTGNLTDMCRQASLSVETRNRNALKVSIERLRIQNLIVVEQENCNYKISIVPKEKKIEISEKTLDIIKSITPSRPSESVEWCNILKVYLWIDYNSGTVATNRDIGIELGLSEQVCGKANRAISKHLPEVFRETIKTATENGHIITLGQRFEMGVDFKG